MNLRRKTFGGASAAAVLTGLALFVAACGGGGYGAAATTGGASGASGAASPSSSSGAQIRTASGTAGTYLTDASGRALYLWVADGNGRSSCTGACAKYWPPLIAKGKPAAASGVKAGELGTTKRADGSEQVTYNGHPLYYYVGDERAGDTAGQGSDDFGAEWWLVTPAGAAITS